MGYHGLGRGGLKNSVKKTSGKKKKKKIQCGHLNKCDKFMCFKMNEKNNKNQSKNISSP